MELNKYFPHIDVCLWSENEINISDIDRVISKIEIEMASFRTVIRIERDGVWHKCVVASTFSLRENKDINSIYLEFIEKVYFTLQHIDEIDVSIISLNGREIYPKDNVKGSELERLKFIQTIK